jgi:nucleotide-binding universal stress UspA family protein
MPETIAYRRILALVELGSQDASWNARLVRRAAALARASGAQLRLLQVVDVETGLDGGPGLTPGQEARAYEAALLPRLRVLAQATGLAGVTCHVRMGRPATAVRGFTDDWAPDLVITPHRGGWEDAGPWDVLTLGHNAPSWRQRLQRWLKSDRLPDLPLANPA